MRHPSINFSRVIALTKLKWPTWLLYVLPMGVSLTILIAPGPYLYEAIFNPIEANAPSISKDFDAKGQLVVPSIKDWLLNSTHWHLLMIGLIAAYFSLEGRSLRSLTLYALFPISLGLAFHGLMPEELLDEGSTEAVTKRAISIAIGCVALFFVISSMLLIYSKLVDSSKNRNSGLFSASLSLLVISLFCSLLIYSLIFFLFQPLASDFRGRAEIPLQGIYLVSDKDECKTRGHSEESDHSELSFVPQRIENASTSLEGAEGATTFSWQNANSNASFKAEFFLLSGCFSYDASTNLNLESPSLLAAEIEKLVVQWDEGHIGIESAEIETSSFRFQHPYPTFYWIDYEDKDPTTERVVVTNFMADKSQLVGEVAGQTTFFFRAPLQKSDGETSTPASRSLLIDTGGEKYAIQLKPIRTEIDLTEDSRLGCKLVENQIDANLKEQYALNTAALIIRLTPSYLDSQIYSTFDSEISFSGLQGWAKVHDISLEEFTSQSFGTTHFASFENLQSLSVDETSKETDQDSDILAFGDTYVYNSNEGGIGFSGRSDRIWVDSKLQNGSYWDGLPLEWRIALIGWIGALIWILRGPLKTLVRHLKSDQAILQIPRA